MSTFLVLMLTSPIICMSRSIEKEKKKKNPLIYRACRVLPCLPQHFDYPGFPDCLPFPGYGGRRERCRGKTSRGWGTGPETQIQNKFSSRPGGLGDDSETCFTIIGVDENMEARRLQRKIPIFQTCDFKHQTLIIILSE
jgi:hypothetical protein